MQYDHYTKDSDPFEQLLRDMDDDKYVCHCGEESTELAGSYDERGRYFEYVLCEPHYHMREARIHLASLPR